MLNVIDVASYVVYSYNKIYNRKIDEMKLHKLLYFLQREAIIVHGEPLFEESFYGWKFGPVLKSIRRIYKEDRFKKKFDNSLIQKLKPIVDFVLRQYGMKDSWSLSRLTHGEYSWQKSRIGILDNASGDRAIKVDDIQVDAQRVKIRRKVLERLKAERIENAYK